ncbi:MAG: molybdenum cofactor biosynthesis protein MoaE [Gammaproteobacteria bacterium]|nr:molybdenum cofactor biosynthesis protein MoaE [Gammaproteobacteria bacterium]MCF6258664.1 molybdenum cofactor biosynthesis protein MoaE [Gammaproteobacteria bacterium]
MSVELRGKPFDPWQALQAYQNAKPELAGKFGATSIFVGTMRDFNDGNDVQAMTLEHYPAMTQKHLEAISSEAGQRWDILDTLIIHRYGDIQPNDPIVLLAVWSAHRSESFPACRYLIEELKTRAPFWKQEKIGANSHWVEHNTLG